VSLIHFVYVSHAFTLHRSRADERAGEQSGLDAVWLPDHFVVAASSGMARLRVDRKSG